jgi:hypothetical protein
VVVTAVMVVAAPAAAVGWIPRPPTAATNEA